MKAADGTPSTLKKLPERPSLGVAKPSPWAGPKLISESEIDKSEIGDFYLEAGAGEPLMGLLTIANGKA